MQWHPRDLQGRDVKIAAAPYGGPIGTIASLELDLSLFFSSWQEKVWLSLVFVETAISKRFQQTRKITLYDAMGKMLTALSVPI